MVDDATRRAAEARLVRRLGEAVELLSPSGIVVTPLDAGQATAVLAAACNPDSLIPPNSGLAGSDEVITTAPDEGWDDAAFGRPRSPPPTSSPTPRTPWTTASTTPPRTPTTTTTPRGGTVDEDQSASARSRHPAVQPPIGRASAFTPDAISVRPRALEVGGEWVASFAVTGYPREVHPGWLQPLLTYPGRVDVSLHIEPIDPVTAANRLKKQLSKLESGAGTPARKAGCSTRRSKPPPRTPTTCPRGSPAARASSTGSGCT